MICIFGFLVFHINKQYHYNPFAIFNMKFNLRRITTTGNFIPEIEGLRFIAICSVVFCHLGGFIIEKVLNRSSYAAGMGPFEHLLSNGRNGVEVFFAISGFILGIPFAKYYLAQGPKINLKHYFLRRLTRLEPPYILVMTVLFFGSVFVIHDLTLSEGLKSYLASITYTHNFVYGSSFHPLINSPAWSLEIEIQFYILAPLLALLFTIPKINKRILTFLSLALLFIFLNHIFDYSAYSIVNYLFYFLAGLIIADIYTSKVLILPKTRFDVVFATIAFCAIWLHTRLDFYVAWQKMIWELIQFSSVFLLLYYVIIHGCFKWLKKTWVTNIGGMCYSIYLLHYPIISLVGNIIIAKTVFGNVYANIILYCVIILLAVLFISIIFYVLIERPCMRKDWYKRFVIFK